MSQAFFQSSVTNPHSNQFIDDKSKPTYLDKSVRKSLDRRVKKAKKELKSCCACPRKCEVNRMKDKKKFCQIGRHARVASFGAHHGEEACLRGSAGSGTIFFAGCNLRCVFCQNADISQSEDATKPSRSREVDADAMADLMLDLQAEGCHNINLVTPEHIVPQIVEGLTVAIEGGLNIPIVYNTSAYDAVSSLNLMEGLIDIYMPDFKFWEKGTAKRLCKAGDYPKSARAAIKEMHRQVGDLHLNSGGLAVRGLLVRHLEMPGLLNETESIFRWLAEEISKDTYVNIMSQYRPSHKVGKPAGEAKYADINRPTTSEETDAAHAAARRAGLWRFDQAFR